MAYTKIVTITCCVFTLLAARADEGDWILRQELNATVKLSERYTLISRSAVFLFEEMSDLQAVFTGLNVGCNVLPTIRLEAGYRHIWLSLNDENRAERRSQIALAWSDTFGKVRVGNRSRLEYRDYDWERDDDLRFRNQTAAVFSWSKLPDTVSPFMEEEFFLGRNRGTIEQNWVTGGLQWKAAKTFRLKAGYRWITIRVKDEWENRNQIVSGINLSF